MIYKCKKEFTVPYLDEDGDFTDEMMKIEKGSIWELEENNEGISDIRLSRTPSDGGWIEITFRRLMECFRPQGVERNVCN